MYKKMKEETQSNLKFYTSLKVYKQKNIISTMSNQYSSQKISERKGAKLT